MAGKGELSNGLTDAVVRVAAFMSSSPSTTQRLLHMQEHWVVETGPEETIVSSGPVSYKKCLPTSFIACLKTAAVITHAKIYHSLYIYAFFLPYASHT